MVAPVAIRDRLAGAVSIPIVDTHIHLFDTARPQGVPWPDKNDAVLYKRVLDVAAKDSIVVGVIGDLEPVHGEAGIHPRTHSVGPGRLGARYCLPRRSWRTWRG